MVVPPQRFRKILPCHCHMSSEPWGVKACRLDIGKLELLTNHVPQGVTARHYLETSDLRDYHPEVQAIGDYIENEGRIAAAKASGANVVKLPERA